MRELRLTNKKRTSVMIIGFAMAACSPSARIIISDALNHPVAVESVASNALILRGGLRVDVPGAEKVFETTGISRGILGAGVELAPGGVPYVLVEVLHDCANDPIQYQLERVPLRQLVEVIVNSNPATPPPISHRVFAGIILDPNYFF